MAFKAPPELLLRTAIRRTLSHTRPQCTTTNAGGTYRAAVCEELGKPLVIQTQPRKALADHEVRVSTRYAAINFADILMTMGKYQVKKETPFIPGSEVVGIVTEVGSNVSSCKSGDKVLGMMMGGSDAWAEEVQLPEMGVVKLPPHASLSQAAGLIIAYGTAWLALTRKANIKPGETVLVTAAAGSVGLAAVDLAANVFNCKVIGACGGPEKCAIVKQKGASHTIDYKTENVRDRLKEITGGQGPDIVFECVGGKLFEDCLRSLAFEGRMVVIGFAGGDIPKVPANLALVKSASIVGLWWGNYAIRNPQVFQQSLVEVIKLFMEGKVKPHVSVEFPLDEVNEAMKFIFDRKSTGKVLLKTN